MAEIEQLTEMLSLLKKQIILIEQQVKAAGERLEQARKEAPAKPSRKGIGGRKPLHIKCGMPGCSNPHQARGLCAAHYAAVKRAAMKAGEDGLASEE